MTNPQTAAGFRKLGLNETIEANQVLKEDILGLCYNLRNDLLPKSSLSVFESIEHVPLSDPASDPLPARPHVVSRHR